jgi:hypothetical protein
MKASSIDIGSLRDAPRAGEKLSAERDLRPSRNIEWDGVSCAFIFLQVVFIFAGFLLVSLSFFVSFATLRFRRTDSSVPSQPVRHVALIGWRWQ